MKYIVVAVEGKESIFVFPRTINHDRMFEVVQRLRLGDGNQWSRDFLGSQVVGAGFIDNFTCQGRSETLNVDSRGDIDTLLLRKD